MSTPVKEKKFGNRKISMLSKGVCTALLLTILFWFEVITLEGLSVVFNHPGPSLLAFLMILTAFMIGVIRWKLLLDALEIHVNFWILLKLYAASLFIGNFLPGALGGDAIRALYIVRETGGQKNVSVMSTIVVDRLMGLIGFMTLGLVLILIRNKSIMLDHPSTAWHQVLAIAMVSILLICFGIFMYAKKMSKKMRMKVYQKNEEHNKLKKILLKCNEYFVQVIELYRHQKFILIQTWILSLLISSLVVSAVPILAHPFGYIEMSNLDFQIAAVVANLSNVIPLTPGGIGIGEGVFDQICHSLESIASSNAYGNIFFQYRIAATFFNLLGAIGFILYSQSAKNKEILSC